MPPTFSHLMIKVKRIGWLTQVAMKKNNLEQLSQLAFDAQKNSHSPYSNFKVGAAVLTPNGETFAGCNVESAAFPLGQCAEATAARAAKARLRHVAPRPCRHGRTLA